MSVYKPVVYNKYLLNSQWTNKSTSINVNECLILYSYSQYLNVSINNSFCGIKIFLDGMILRLIISTKPKSYFSYFRMLLRSLKIT